MEAAGNKDDEEKFEHKYNVLQGKYNKEMKVMRTELGDMRSLLATMRSDPIEAKPGEKLLNDTEIEEYGSDMIDVVKRAAREEFMPLITQLQEENTRLTDILGNVSENVVIDARDNMLRTLDLEIPNWRELNTDSAFLAWLEGIDAFAGEQRKTLLTQASGESDTARVMAFFKGYLDENAVTVTAPQTTAPIEPKVDMMSMAAPGTVSTGAQIQSAHSDKRVYTQADIAAFYRSVQKGEFKGRDAEKAAIEQDIYTAGPEGRIR